MNKRTLSPYALMIQIDTPLTSDPAPLPEECDSKLPIWCYNELIYCALDPEEPEAHGYIALNPLFDEFAMSADEFTSIACAIHNVFNSDFAFRGYVVRDDGGDDVEWWFVHAEDFKAFLQLFFGMREGSRFYSRVSDLLADLP